MECRTEDQKEARLTVAARCREGLSQARDGSSGKERPEQDTF